jgi:uncharacterized protein (DUF1697 family)
MATRYIAFLRAVNVGGRSMKMADLRMCFEDLGLRNVGTVIQSGNAYFDAGRGSRAALVARIEAAIGSRFGFEVPTILRTCEEVEATLKVAGAQYVDGRPVVDKERIVMFLDRAVPRAELPISTSRGDVAVSQLIEVGAHGTDAIVAVRRIDGRMTNYATFVEKQLAARGTGRWLHTTAQILNVARET